MDEPVDNSRLDKVEKKVDDLTEKVVILESKVADHHLQIGRVASHIESEVGLARNQLSRIDLKLFGKDDDVDGGKIGHINKRIYQMEKWFFAMICAAGIIVFLIAIYNVAIK